jgi:hypothetical protein
MSLRHPQAVEADALGQHGRNHVKDPRGDNKLTASQFLFETSVGHGDSKLTLDSGTIAHRCVFYKLS